MLHACWPFFLRPIQRVSQEARTGLMITVVASAAMIVTASILLSLCALLALADLLLSLCVLLTLADLLLAFCLLLSLMYLLMRRGRASGARPCLNMATMFPVNLPFSIGRSALNTVFAAVIADASVVYMVDDDFTMIDMGDAMDVDVIEGAVVIEMVGFPIATGITGADIAESVINATVIADLVAPVSWMPAIDIADVAPIPRGPQGTDERRHDPCARYPIITAGTDCPVSRGPDITGPWNHGLFVHRQWWRRCIPGIDADADRDIRGGSRPGYGHGEQDCAADQYAGRETCEPWEHGNPSVKPSTSMVTMTGAVTGA